MRSGKLETIGLALCVASASCGGRPVATARTSDGPRCIEERYSPTRGPTLFAPLNPHSQGIAEFVSDIPLSRGTYLAVVLDDSVESQANEAPFVKVVSSSPREDGRFLVLAEFDPSRDTPVAAVGPFTDKRPRPRGTNRHGKLMFGAPVGVSNLQYEVYLQAGKLEVWSLRCSDSTYLEQIWLVTDERELVQSRIER